VHKIFFLKIPWRTTISSDFWKGFVEASHLNLRLATVTFNVRHRLFQKNRLEVILSGREMIMKTKSIQIFEGF